VLCLSVMASAVALHRFLLALSCCLLLCTDFLAALVACAGVCLQPSAGSLALDLQHSCELAAGGSQESASCTHLSELAGASV
jgi:hypothetical protein